MRKFPAAAYTVRAAGRLSPSGARRSGIPGNFLAGPYLCAPPSERCRRRQGRSSEQKGVPRGGGYCKCLDSKDGTVIVWDVTSGAAVASVMAKDRDILGRPL